MSKKVRNKPDFAYSNEPNNVHLLGDSPCIDKGDNTGIGIDEVDMDWDDRILDGDNNSSAIVDMGADEVACTDVYHPLDWNADGVVNYLEFEKFSRSWMTYDPNNPLCDPNNPNYVSDPNSINFISQTDKERFNPVCDLDQDMAVDLADLAIFFEEYNWLWVACWRLDLQEMLLSMMMGGSSSQSESQITSSETISISIAKTEEPEKSIGEQITELAHTVEFLEQLWLTDDSIQEEIDADVWRQFMEKVYQSLIDIQETEISSYNSKEVKP